MIHKKKLKKISKRFESNEYIRIIVWCDYGTEKKPVRGRFRDDL